MKNRLLRHAWYNATGEVGRGSRAEKTAEWEAWGSLHGNASWVQKRRFFDIRNRSTPHLKLWFKSSFTSKKEKKVFPFSFISLDHMTTLLLRLLVPILNGSAT